MWRESTCGGAGGMEPWRSIPRGAGSIPETCRLRESEGENMRGKRGRSGMFRRIAAGGAAFLLLLALAVGGGGAQEQAGSRPDDPGRQPIEITADRLLADSARESVTFEGNVVAHQADVTLHADRLYAEYSNVSHAIEKITAEGNVRVDQGGKEARAARAVFYNLEQRIVLTGGADPPQGAHGDHLPAGKPVRGDGRGGGARPGRHTPARLPGNEGEGKTLKSLAVRDLRKRYREIG